ncbi:AraC family transcriptional regulator [Nitratireductor sp. StC3]|uniref:AraC family transcriptional regulator n=1 Tax=Nitratireductor sp. StC3 TaxID=2126741 RepID=UPI000D0D56E5|nr:AraC family transcriptional regulator [Nitratireductor sp. StC3]PSM19708.1 AraC family transcriptional regulator [Nitratireductor sp. StC3]
MTGPGAGLIRSRPVATGLEIVETAGLRTGYRPHRHDSYVIGTTAHGVQRFRYRGEERHALAGQAFILHPDERHDGRPGTEDGYGYRALHIAPRLIAEASGLGPLPFVASPVLTDAGLIQAIGALIEARVDAPSDTALVSALADLTAALERLAGRPRRKTPIAKETLRRIKVELDDTPGAAVSMSALEAAYGLSRFAIARQFRRVYGVSPMRYGLMRRLDVAKRRILAGESLADAALAAGFSDQSHMTRHFLRAFGMTPGRWQALHESR